MTYDCNIFCSNYILVSLIEMVVNKAQSIRIWLL